MVRVVNLKHAPALAISLARYPVHSRTVLIDRRTKWGNPFRIGEHGLKELAFERYRPAL